MRMKLKILALIKDTIMNILRHSGKDYAWNNGHTYNRIDWALVNGK